MARSTWIKGCGIGCAVVVVIAAFGVFGVVRLVQNMSDEFEQIETVSDELTARHGRAGEFTPDASGAVPAVRLERFLEVRESTEGTRDELDETLARLSAAEEGKVSLDPGQLFGLFRSGVGILPRFVEYYQARNQALLDLGVGIGEYLYLYAIGYYSWLGHEPGSGPPFVIWDDSDDGAEEGEDGSRRRRGAWGFEDRDDPTDIRRARDRRIRERLHRPLLSMLRNQLSATRGGPDVGGRQPWRRQLEDEIEAMERDPRRVPWQDGLPAPLEDSLRPYRDRLEASWNELCNPVETMTAQD